MKRARRTSCNWSKCSEELLGRVFCGVCGVVVRGAVSGVAVAVVVAVRVLGETGVGALVVGTADMVGW